MTQISTRFFIPYTGMKLVSMSFHAQTPPSSREEKGSGVTQVQILGLAPEAWSGQPNRRAAFNGITRKRELVLLLYCSILILH